MPATRLNTFNGTGSVTSDQIAALVPSPATTVGGSTQIPVLTINSKGQVTSTTTSALSITPTAISDQANSSTGFFDLPAGTTAERPATPTSGQIRFNQTLGFLEVYNGSAWKSVSVQQSYTSPEQTVTSGGQLVLAHSLGVSPKIITQFITCTTAEAGYSIGDVLMIGGTTSNSANDSKFTAVVCDATNLTIRFGSGPLFNTLQKSSGNGIDLTTTNWTYRINAFS